MPIHMATKPKPRKCVAGISLTRTSHLFIRSGKAKYGSPSTIITIPTTLRKNFMTYSAECYDMHATIEKVENPGPEEDPALICPQRGSYGLSLIRGSLGVMVWWSIAEHQIPSAKSQGFGCSAGGGSGFRLRKRNL